MTVKFIKLVNGDDLVSQIEEFDDVIDLTMPARVRVVREEGAPKTLVELYLPHIKGFSCSIPASSVLLTAEPNDSLLTYYSENILPIRVMPTA